MHVPFHVYSMKQAIEEGYILDVLANCLTYDTKWRLRNLAVEQAASALSNPEVDERKARRELVRFAELHPTTLNQKAKVIVEDFRDSLAGRLDGRAKAMVVTTGRQHALPRRGAGRAPGRPPLLAETLGPDSTQVRNLDKQAARLKKSQ
jgi:type I restriction enzyme R subunit